jgi:hypothetical protein
MGLSTAITSMKTAACLFALFTVSTAACAGEPAAFAGAASCRVAWPLLKANETVVWKGPCKDGFADGAGVLERNQQGILLNTLDASYEVTMVQGRISGDGKLKYKNGDTYTGSFKDGQRDGKGYTAFANGDQYEGDYKNGLPHGAGIALNRDGSEYQGEWKAGKFDGVGSIQYALGGGYTGAWKAGKFHGKGVLTYAGSGRKLEAEFDNGRVRGTHARAPLPQERFTMKSDAVTGSHLARQSVSGSVPFDKSYAELTPEQQALVKQPYHALEDGDEPPYPVKGLQPIYNWLKQAQDKVKVVGDLRLDVLVGKDGNPVSVKTIGAPSPEIAKFATLVVSKEKYKPAICRGAPCEMIFPFNMKFVMH